MMRVLHEGNSVKNFRKSKIFDQAAQKKIEIYGRCKLIKLLQSEIKDFRLQHK